MAVKPGYIGALGITIDTATVGSPVVLGIKTGAYRESIQKHNTNSTASPVVTPTNGVPVLQSTNINGSTQGRLHTTAQWGAQGGGDPPDFSGVKLYGTHYVTYQAGTLIVGYMLMEEFANTLNVDGTLDYEMSLLSTGPITRTQS